MDKKTKRSLDYIDVLEKEDGVVIPKLKTKMVVTSYVKKYSNSMYLTFDLNASTWCMLDYLSQRMDDENRIATNAIMVEDFIGFLRYISHGQCNYTVHTAKFAIKTLKKKRILIQLSRGTSIVNPEYFFAGTEQNRMKLLKELYEKKYLVHNTTNRFNELVEIREVEEDLPEEQIEAVKGFDLNEMLRRIENG